MKASATKRKLNHQQRQGVDKCADYLLKYRKFLQYAQYLAIGLPIATGVIEGACRYLVKDRMELTGARWRLAGAETILRLRALQASGDFEQGKRILNQIKLEPDKHCPIQLLNV